MQEKEGFGSFDLVIEPGQKLGHYWRDLWAFRELFYFMAWRDVLVRYKQTIIGIAWALLRPLLTMLVFTFVFGRLAELPAEGDAPYAVMVLAALLPWQLFASALSDASNSLLSSANMISKVYFPRLIVPGSSIIVSLVDFLISLSILVVLMAWYRFVPSERVFFLPLFFLLVVVTAIGAGAWLAALNVKYRDIRYVVPFVVQLGLYISPVGFSSALVPEKWRLLYSLNPMVGVIDGFRWALLGTDNELYWPGFWLSCGFALLLLVGGIGYFRAAEKSFADHI